MKGYQLIESDSISKLNHFEGIQNLDLITILWLVEVLKSNDQLKKYPIEIGCVMVNYQGTYPCVGLHYLDETTPDMGDYVKREIERIIDQSSFLSFYNFIMNNQQLILDTKAKILEK
ncbi:MAG TPA: hypothetical protein VGF30_04295 [Bacteroidia bacterium]